MKTLITLALIAASAPLALLAQANQVVTSSKEVYDRQEKFIIASAELMPADKYTFKPTAGQVTFAKAIAHLVDANSYVCPMLTTAPPAARGAATSETLSKDALVAALKASFQVCDKAMAGLQDAQLGDTIAFFGGKPAPRARALIEEIGDLEDHYSQLAAYLRLNDIIPPSAAPKK